MEFKRALVTGASSGLGKALCKILGDHNISLIITARDEQKLLDLKENLPKNIDIISLSADLVKKEERKKIIDLIHLHKPDLIINNAGFGLYGEALFHTTEEQMEILELNANALLEISLESARTLIDNKQKGVIFNVASAAAFFVYPNFNVYAASKTFVMQFSRAFHKEVSPFGISVLTVCPGQISTEFRKRASKNYPQQEDWRSMPVDSCAKLIWEQIQKQTTYSIIDWRYKILTFIGRFLIPKSLLQAVLKKEINRRYLH